MKIPPTGISVKVNNQQECDKVCEVFEKQGFQTEYWSGIDFPYFIENCRYGFSNYGKCNEATELSYHDFIATYGEEKLSKSDPVVVLDGFRGIPVIQRDDCPPGVAYFMDRKALRGTHVFGHHTITNGVEPIKSLEEKRMKFKVGDEVEVIQSAPKGHRGLVVRAGVTYDVKFKTWHEGWGEDHNCWCVKDHELKLVTPDSGSNIKNITQKAMKKLNTFIRGLQEPTKSYVRLNWLQVQNDEYEITSEGRTALEMVQFGLVEEKSLPTYAQAEVKRREAEEKKKK